MWTDKARTVAAMVGLSLWGGLAHAVDGTFLITQNLVNASGGFPYTLSQAGSYRLASNLTVPDENTTAIRILVSNVTLDLNGFSIIGPVVCTGTPPTCTPANGTGVGVDGAAANITVMNGTVRGMGRGGVSVGDNGTVRGMRVLSIGGPIAISLRNGSVAAENIVKDVAIEGIFGGSANTMTNNVVTNVGQFGTCLNTAGSGGIGGVISNNTCRDANFGIGTDGGYLVIGNSVTNARNGGLALQPTDGYANNVLNNPGAFFGNVFGGVNMGHNLCGTALCP